MGIEWAKHLWTLRIYANPISRNYWIEDTILEDNIEINIKEIGCESGNSIRLNEDNVLCRAALSAEMVFRVTEEAGYLLPGGVIIHFSENILLHGVS